MDDTMRALTISSALILLTIFILLLTSSANAGTPPIMPTLAPGTPNASNHMALATVIPTAPGTTVMPTVVPASVSTVTPIPETATPIPATPTPEAGGMDLISLAIILIVVVAVIAAALLYLYIRR
jgi:hypothetical protein